MLGTILIVLLILALLGVLPRWSHSRSWGYAPTGGVGLVLMVVVVLLVLGRISRLLVYSGQGRLSLDRDLTKPIVWVFPKVLVCLDCGFAEFAVPDEQLETLRSPESSYKRKRSRRLTGSMAVA